MKRNSIKTILENASDQRTEEILGWIRTKRESKNVIFIEINDGSCLKNIQIVIDKSAGIISEQENKQILTGASVRVKGTVQAVEAKNQNIEIHADTLELIGEAPETYPLQKKRHTFEFLREISHLRPRTNTFGALMRVRNSLSQAIHQFFQQRGFLWIHTPIITGSDAEGAGNMFQVTTLDMETAARDKQGNIDYSQDFFGKKAHLTVSGQLEVENYACSMSKVYTFGPTFRAENSNTSRHLSEFWMVEPEMAFYNLDDNRALAEDFIKSILSVVLRDCPQDMTFFDQWISKGTIENIEKVISTPFVHIPYSDAIKELENATVKFDFTPSWGTDLQAEHERYLTEKIAGGPAAITDYPAPIKPFYMKQNDDGKTVRAMDILVPKLGEIIGGSQREEDAGKLETSMQEKGIALDDYQWYIDLRRFGTVPHSGFGLGFERIVQYVTGMQNIRDVIPFPRTPKTLTL